MNEAAEKGTLSSAEPENRVISFPPASDPDVVYYRYSDMVFRLAMARCRKRSDAEDVLQEVFVRYMRSHPQFESAEHQRAWLIKTTVNCSNSLLTSPWRKRTVMLTGAEASDEGLSNSDTAGDVYSAVMKLPKLQRTVIHLFYYEGYKISEIASLIDSNENTVKSWLRRAKNRLEKELKGDYFDV